MREIVVSDASDDHRESERFYMKCENGRNLKTERRLYEKVIEKSHVVASGDGDVC